MSASVPLAYLLISFALLARCAFRLSRASRGTSSLGSALRRILFNWPATLTNDPPDEPSEFRDQLKTCRAVMVVLGLGWIAVLFATVKWFE